MLFPTLRLGLEERCAVPGALGESFEFQIGAFRPIRVDHTDFFKWLLKLIHSNRCSYVSLSPTWFMNGHFFFPLFCLLGRTRDTLLLFPRRKFGRKKGRKNRADM